MKRISDRNDLRREVNDLMGSAADEAVIDAATDAICADSDRPRYGDDWQDYLEAVDLWGVSAGRFYAVPGKFLAVMVDEENSAELWWQEVRSRWPMFARSLTANGCAVITAGLLDELKTAPGYFDGPEYAPTPVMDFGVDDSGFTDATDGPYGVFESLC
jgi:hypothetical protein